MSLANRYRPHTFDQVVGQEHITTILQAHVHAHHTQSKHATNYLLYGPRGTGKTSSARILAKALNCLSQQEGNPCNTCKHCVAIQNNETMDIIEIDAASHTGVDNIRQEIIEKAGYRPAQLPYKVYIIDEVHMLSKGAFNALLKIMEEPGEYLRFILATTEIHKVPDTIISRCQVFHFKRIATTSIVKHLEHIAKQESIQTESEALELLASMSEGCMRDAVKYMDQVSIIGKIDTEHVTNFLGIAPLQLIEQTIHDILQARKQQDYDIVIQRIEQLQEQAVDLQQFTIQLMDYIDNHIQQNPEAYSTLAQTLHHIIQQAKRHPHIALLYKSLLYQFVHAGTQQKQTTIHTPSSATTKHTKKTKKNTKPEESEAIEKTKRAEKTAKTDKTDTTQKNQEDKDKKNEKDREDQENQENQDIENKKDEHKSQKDTVNKESSQKEKENKEENRAQITQKFINAIERGSLQSILQDQSQITGRTGTIVHMIIINPAAKIQVQKRAIREQLEQTLSDILGSPHALEFTHMSKEEFFAKYF